MSIQICNSVNKKDATKWKYKNKFLKGQNQGGKCAGTGWERLEQAGGFRGHLLCRWCGQSEKEGRAELRDSKDLKEKIFRGERKYKNVHQPRYNCLAKETTE